MRNKDFHMRALDQLTATRGIARAAVLADKDRVELLAKELDAEKRSLLGLGKVVNTGVRAVLKCDNVYAAMTTMAFDWGCEATLVLKKGGRLVGEEVRDEARLAELRALPGVWFMHKNFVIYKDRIDFPRDVMQKICHFEIPGLPADWFLQGLSTQRHAAATMAVPSTAGDGYLKERFFDGTDEHGTGTILMGIDCREPVHTQLMLLPD